MSTRNRTFGIVLVAVLGSALTVSSVWAQSDTKSNFGSNRASQFVNRNGISQFTSSRIRQRIRSSSVTNYGSSRSNLGANRPPSSGRSSKPFSSISRRPAVSPYLALSNSFNQVSDYYNIVRPQQRQRKVNQQLQRQSRANQSRLNQMSARPPYNPRGDASSAPTGHSAVFQNLGTYLDTGRYYPIAPR